MAQRWDSEIPIISLWMPWANWVMLGWKIIETRRHKRFAGLAGKRIGIHATQHWDESAIEAARPFLTEQQICNSYSFLKIGGAILGTVQGASHRLLMGNDSRHALIDCQNTQRYGLILLDPQTIEAIPAKGKQGIWYYRGQQ